MAETNSAHLWSSLTYFYSWRWDIFQAEICGFAEGQRCEALATQGAPALCLKYKSVVNTYVERLNIKIHISTFSWRIRRSGNAGALSLLVKVAWAVWKLPPSDKRALASLLQSPPLCRFPHTTVAHPLPSALLLAPVGCWVCDLHCIILNYWGNTIKVVYGRLSESSVNTDQYFLMVKQ